MNSTYAIATGEHAVSGAAGPAELHTWPPKLRQLGYSGISVAVGHERDLDALSDVGDELERQRLALFALAVQLDVAAGGAEARVNQAVAYVGRRKGLQPPGGTLLEIALASSDRYDQPSSARADARAAAAVSHLADVALAAGLRPCLAPRAGRWMQRAEDAVRLAMRLNRPDLGVALDLTPQRGAAGAEWVARLELALPRLWGVALTPLGGANAVQLAEITIRLQRGGYAGPIGLACEGSGDDAFEALRSARAAYLSALGAAALAPR